MKGDVMVISLAQIFWNRPDFKQINVCLFLKCGHFRE